MKSSPDPFLSKGGGIREKRRLPPPKTPSPDLYQNEWAGRIPAFCARTAERWVRSILKKAGEGGKEKPLGDGYAQLLHRAGEEGSGGK
jgi:hypothetical protein